MSAISLPYLGDFYRNENSGAYCKKVRQSLYRASYRALAGERNSHWGVKIESGNYTLYAGNTYAGRLTQFDEVNDIPNTMTLTGMTNVRFSKFTGRPNAIGTISIVLNGKTTTCAIITETGLIAA